MKLDGMSRTIPTWVYSLSTVPSRFAKPKDECQSLSRHA